MKPVGGSLSGSSVAIGASRDGFRGSGSSAATCRLRTEKATLPALSRNTASFMVAPRTSRVTLASTDTSFSVVRESV